MTCDRIETFKVNDPPIGLAKKFPFSFVITQFFLVQVHYNVVLVLLSKQKHTKNNNNTLTLHIRLTTFVRMMNDI